MTQESTVSNMPDRHVHVTVMWVSDPNRINVVSLSSHLTV